MLEFLIFALMAITFAKDVVRYFFTGMFSNTELSKQED